MTHDEEITGLKTSQSDKKDLEYIKLMLEEIIESNPNIDADLEQIESKANNSARRKRGLDVGRGEGGRG